MKIKNFNNIVFEDSYVLGWVLSVKKLLLFLQLLLTKNHPEFEDYNEETEFGCYKLAVIRFNDALSIEGLPLNMIIPKWDSKLKEFIDVAEINEVKEIGNNIIFKTDDYDITVRCDDIDVSILQDFSERAFEKFIK